MKDEKVIWMKIFQNKKNFNKIILVVIVFSYTRLKVDHKYEIQKEFNID